MHIPSVITAIPTVITSTNIASISTASTVIVAVPFIPVIPYIHANMANIYAPLQLPANPRAMPQDYQTKITYFDNTTPVIALQHTKKMQDYFESYEIDDEAMRMRIFV